MGRDGVLPARWGADGRRPPASRRLRLPMRLTTLVRPGGAIRPACKDTTHWSTTSGAMAAAENGALCSNLLGAQTPCAEPLTTALRLIQSAPFLPPPKGMPAWWWTLRRPWPLAARATPAPAWTRPRTRPVAARAWATGWRTCPLARAIMLRGARAHARARTRAACCCYWQSFMIRRAFPLPCLPVFFFIFASAPILLQPPLPRPPRR